MTQRIATIQNGIVCLRAKWSGDAIWAYEQLKSHLENHQSALEHLTCIDIDHDPEVYKLPELSGKIHGHGEAAVVKNGRVVFVNTLGKDKAKIFSRCSELLVNFEH